MRSDHCWIDRADELGALASALPATPEIALDTESNSMFAYRERVCLVQLHLIGQEPALYAIDPLAFDALGEATSPLVEWLALGRRVLVHGGEYDVAVLKRELGVAPANLFDTQAAAAMLGMQRTGYANLCGELLDVKISKEHQQFDWARRPVPAAAKGYALDDVRYLPALARVIEERVGKADLEEEVAIACQAVAEALPHVGTGDADRFWRVVGGERLSREELGRVAALVSWREREAEARDQPPGRLVSKETLLQLARREVRSPADLEGVGLSRRLLADRGDSLVSALKSAGAVPEKPRRPAHEPLVEARKTRLKGWRETEAQRRGVVAQAVLPSRALEALALGATDLATVPQLGEKRIRMYGETIAKLAR